MGVEFSPYFKEYTKGQLSMYPFLFALTGFLGYFAFMILFMIIAIATAKNKTAWIWYAIGAIAQLLSLLGNQKTANMYGTDTSLYWIAYIILLLITARIVNSRYIKNKSKPNIDLQDNDNEGCCASENENSAKGSMSETAYTTPKIEPQPTPLKEETLFCRKCGTQLLTDSVYCNKCGTKVETL